MKVGAPPSGFLLGPCLLLVLGSGTGYNSQLEVLTVPMATMASWALVFWRLPFCGREPNDKEVATFCELGLGPGLDEVVSPVLDAGGEGPGGAGDGAGHVRERAQAVQVLVLGHKRQLAKAPSFK